MSNAGAIRLICNVTKMNFTSSVFRSEELSVEEQNNIARHIGKRDRDMGRALGLSDGEIEGLAIDYHGQHLEKVFQIIRLWKNSLSCVPSRCAFIRAIGNMIPYPQDIIECVMYE